MKNEHNFHMHDKKSDIKLLELIEGQTTSNKLNFKASPPNCPILEFSHLPNHPECRQRYSFD